MCPLGLLPHDHRPRPEEECAAFSPIQNTEYNEIEMLRELGESEYLMTFYEIHETVHSVYMVIEYLPGGELLKVIS